MSEPHKIDDATVWRTSPVKVLLEAQHPSFRLLGDSAYPKSRIMVTPYRTPEAANDESKRQERNYTYIYIMFIVNEWRPYICHQPECFRR